MRWYEGVVKDNRLLGRMYVPGNVVYYAKDNGKWVVYLGFGWAVRVMTAKEVNISIEPLRENGKLVPCKYQHAVQGNYETNGNRD